MLYKSKLRGSFGRVYPISLVIIYILCVIEVLIRLNLIRSGWEIMNVPATSMIVCGLFFFVMGILQWMRYQLLVYPWLGFHLGFGCIIIIFCYETPQPLYTTLYIANLLFVILIILINWPTLSSQERYEANARRIFKLASNLISDISDGFTSRPYFAGNYEAEHEDVSGFVRFLNGKFIAKSISREGIVYICFSLNKSVLRVSDPMESSYFAIHQDGGLSVQITEQDYKQYRNKYNFDQLCASLGQVFGRFLQYYKEGYEHRIISELKTAR